MAFFVFFEHSGIDCGGASFVVLENYSGPWPRSFAGPRHDPPIIGRVFFEQEDFELSAGLGIDGAEASGKHTGIIQHQNVASAQVLEQMGKLAVLDLLRIAMQHQQTGLIAPGRGGLGDQTGGQFKIEIGGSHGPTASDSYNVFTILLPWRDNFPRHSRQSAEMKTILFCLLFGTPALELIGADNRDHEGFAAHEWGTFTSVQAATEFYWTGGHWRVHAFLGSFMTGTRPGWDGKAPARPPWQTADS